MAENPAAKKREALKNAKEQWVGREAEVEAAKLFISDQTGGSFTLDAATLDGRTVVHVRNCRDCRVELPPQASLAKLFVEGCEQCSLHLAGRLLTGHLEVWRCSSLEVQVHAPLGTLQADLCASLRCHYSREEHLVAVVHAGVEDFVVTLGEAGQSHQLSGEGAGGAAGPEVQFITRLVAGSLLTERVVRDATDYPTTARELLERRREAAEALAAAGVPAEDPTLPLLEAAARSGGGAAEAEALDEALRGARAEAQRVLGNEAFAAADWASAAVAYTASLAARESVAARNNRAAAFLKLGRHEQALEDAQEAMRLQPGGAKAHFRAGLALHALKRYIEAGEALSRAAELEPANVQVREMRCEPPFVQPLNPPAR